MVVLGSNSSPKRYLVPQVIIVLLVSEQYAPDIYKCKNTHIDTSSKMDCPQPKVTTTASYVLLSIYIYTELLSI